MTHRAIASQYFESAPQDPLDIERVSDTRIMAALVDREFQRGPLRTRIEDDAVLVEKAREVCRQLNWPVPATLNSFYAKAQIGPRPLREWKINRLVAFARQIEANTRNEGVREPKGSTVFEFEPVNVEPVLHFTGLPQS